MNLLSASISGEGISLTGGRQLEVSLNERPNGKKVLVGVRPDDLHPDNVNPIISGKVTVLEPLGPETLIYVETVSGEIIAKADGRSPPQVGDTVSLGAGAEHLHVFDAETGMALS